MKTFTKFAAAASIALIAGAAQAQTMLDTDGDMMLTETEFAPAADMGFVFTAVDSDGDGMVSEAEYNDAARDMADEDDSGDLSVREAQRLDELTRQFDQANADRGLIDYGTADTDGDGIISDDELAAATAQ